MERNMIIAILLSLALWVFWLNFINKPLPPASDQELSQKELQVEKEIKKIEIERPEVHRQIKIHPTTTKTAKNVEIDSKVYSTQLSNLGGEINSLKYNERNIELIVNNRNNAKGYFDFPIHFSEDEFLSGNNLEKAIWNYRIINKKIIFNTVLSINGSSLHVEKAYIFNDEGYFFRIEYTFTNIGKKEFVFPNGYIIVSPSDFIGPNMDFSNTYNSLNSIYFLNGDFEKGSKGGGFFSKGGILERESGETKWVGVMSRYFLLILIPEKFIGTGVIYDSRENTGYRTGMYIPMKAIDQGEKLTKSFKVYIGEKDKEKLKTVETSIIDAADVSSWIEPLRDFLLWCLMKINIFVGNLGWSLVIFSILTKILLLPLTQKSTESMKKMQALGPQINELKEKHKDNPTVLNKKTMELYKKEKINPLGGCLPLLLQMPFFFALYSALINSIELWQAPFILWINDLSLPDTVFEIKGFNINILPLIMTATTFIQQKMTSTEGTSQQQKLMMIMPLILLYIFWNMPSGLVLYWALQNILQIFHQIIITKKESKAN